MLDRAGALADCLAVLRSLRLQNFRCFPQLAIELGEGGGVFVGDNAQGKTSLLEAICVLARLQSPRTHRLRQLIRIDHSAFGIAGSAFGSDRRIDYGREKNAGLSLRIDGDDVESSSEYLQRSGLVVWMANDDLKLVRGPGEDRRHFLDFIGMQLEFGYRRAATRYRRALKARNALLKDRGATRKSIDAYSQILVEEGTFLQTAREKLLGALADHASAAQAHIASENEALQIDYRMSGGGDLAAAFQQSYDRDLDLRQTTVGPHRDDFVLKLNQLSAKDYASEGQQRTVVLALKLGQGRLLQSMGNARPIYLIDDVFGELDTARRNALMRWIPDDVQCFITTTSLAWLQESDRTWPIFEVAGGSCRMKD